MMLIFSCLLQKKSFSKDYHPFDPIRIFNVTSIASSLFMTSIITLDRYVYIAQCLRYKDVMTKYRIFLMIVIAWMASFLFALIPSFVPVNNKNRDLLNDIIQSTLYFSLSSVILYISIYMKRIRHNHSVQVKKDSLRFNIPGKRPNIFNQLNGSMMDVLRLNMETIFFYISTTLTYLLWKYLYQQDNKCLMIVTTTLWLLYIVSNPLVYVLTNVELRTEYKKTNRWS